MNSTNYFDTFISVAEDCPTNVAQFPGPRGDKKTVAQMQYEMIIDNPYKYTSDDVLSHVDAERKEIIISNRDVARKEYFSKGQPCFRASPLTKRYGWGVHSDSHGKIAIYPVNSKGYDQHFKNSNLKQLKAMRSERV